MNWILNIDTSLETAFVGIAKNGVLISSRINENQKDHASFLEPAIQSLLSETSIRLNELAAVAVVYGPGSYTGLRVGMASAKGLCYASGKPLIVLNNLELLSMTAIAEYKKITEDPAFFCPMIDARRMEVYTAVYDEQLNVLQPPHALVLDQRSYGNLLMNSRVVFHGNGSNKWKTLCDHENARFVDTTNKNAAMVQLSFQKLAEQSFISIAYAEPLYIKEFHSTQSNSNTN